MSEKNLLGLTQASQQKKEIALAKTEKAIAFLIENRQKITIRSVAKEARVSVSYIYKYPELAYKIQTLRDRQKYEIKASNQPIKLESDKQDLIDEIKRLKRHIEQLEGKGKSLSKIQQQNLQLQIENQELKQELAYTKRNLQQTRDFILSQSYNTQGELPSRNTD